MSLHTIIEFIDSELSPHENDTRLSWELHDLLLEEDLLADDYWRFEEDGIKKFIEKIHILYEQSARGITFSATWSPDTVIDEEQLSLLDFLNKLASGKISGKTKYLINKTE